MKCGKIFVNIIENLKIKVEKRIFWHDQISRAVCYYSVKLFFLKNEHYILIVTYEQIHKKI